MVPHEIEPLGAKREAPPRLVLSKEVVHIVSVPAQVDALHFGAEELACAELLLPPQSASSSRISLGGGLLTDSYCVVPPRAGTFFSRNLFSLSYNYAAAEGNQQLLHSLDHSNLARTANCSVEARHTTEEQRRMQRDVDAAEAAYRASLAEVRLMRRCLRDLLARCRTRTAAKFRISVVFQR